MEAPPIGGPEREGEPPPPPISGGRLDPIPGGAPGGGPPEVDGEALGSVFLGGGAGASEIRYW